MTSGERPQPGQAAAAAANPSPAAPHQPPGNAAPDPAQRGTIHSGHADPAATDASGQRPPPQSQNAPNQPASGQATNPGPPASEATERTVAVPYPVAAPRSHLITSGAAATAAGPPPPAAAATTSAAPAPAPTGGPRPSDSIPAPAEERRTWRARRYRGIPKLSIGHHVAADDALDRLQLTGVSFGFPVGRDQGGRVATVTLFRPEPTSAMIIGGAWAARLFALRALDFGAKVVVSTDWPWDWARVEQWAAGYEDRVVMIAPRSTMAVTSSADMPVLRVLDLENPIAPQSGPQPAKWQTQLTLLRRFTPAAMTAVWQADLVVTQRLGLEEAATITRQLGFSQRTAQLLQMLRDDMVATLTGEGSRYIWTNPTPAEQRALGLPSRN
ncbi:hypothetical protein ABZ863_06085 [Saccharomonospora sp. NPDC046836]|uniref:hypothetical protein n=1 Tax=Saccharomonospora sp. NPDC046836 TaxID=3156921 RepID=UPI0033DD043C